MEHGLQLGGVIAAVEAIAAVAFIVIAYRLYVVYSRLGLPALEAGLAGFTLLSMSSLVMALAALHPSPRASLALYVSSSILAIGGFYLVNPRHGMHAAIPLGGLKALIALADYLAGMMGLAAAYSTRGSARILLGIIGVSYLVRGTSLLAGLAGLGPGSVMLVLFAGELLRAASAAALAVLYAVPGGSGEEEEE